ncbi:MAG: hypothetical protein ACLFQA_11875 [Bacteroidales bacterium]
MNDFILILVVAIVLMALVFAGMSISILIRKNGRFPVTSIGRNKEMQKRGITCVRHEEMLCNGNGKNRGSCCR